VLKNKANGRSNHGDSPVGTFPEILFRESNIRRPVRWYFCSVG